MIEYLRVSGPYKHVSMVKKELINDINLIGFFFGKE